ncbi:MAG TPA: S-layer homology domain-containing protein, partial [Anaerolineae bacterium]|nr:S-layer homology domain-containing protein [Anaerolineae bacterium]
DFMNVGGASAEVAAGGQLMLSSARTFLSTESVPDPSDVTDEHGHGTHLAGLIAAAANNGPTAGSGIAGLGYPARLLPLKVAGASGVATHADIAGAIVYAADQGASVIVIGFTGPTWSQVLQEAVDYAWDRGCLLVAPAGDAPGFPAFPGGCPHVFGIASLHVSGGLASYSGRGDHVALAAPGGDEVTGIYSSLPTYACTLRTDLATPAYGSLFGTSEAAAHVAAAAGLYAGANGMSPDTGHEGAAIWQALQQGAGPVVGVDPGGWDPGCGYGALSLVPLLAGDGGVSGEPGGIVGRALLASSAAVGVSVTAVPQEGGAEAAVAITNWPAGGYRLASLPPGAYRVTAEAPGHSAEWDGVEVSPGCDLPGIDFRLGDPPAEAALVSGDVPAAALRGRHLELSVTFANTGESTWRRADGYCLRQVAVPSPICAAPDHFDLLPAEAVAPGESRAFSLSLHTPEACGFYGVALQMCQQGGHGLFGGVAAGTVSVTSFLDLPADHWALAEIEAVHQAGIAQGYGDDRYYPDVPVSRDQMAVYLARALAGGDSEVPPGPEEPTFLDVDGDHWAYRYVEYVHTRDVVLGYPDGSYQPEELVNRGQMAVYVARALAGGDAGLEQYTPPETPTFPDVEPGSWNFCHVEYLEDAGVVAGYPDLCYHPEHICSRAQMAVYIARAFGLL